MQNSDEGWGLQEISVGCGTWTLAGQGAGRLLSRLLLLVARTWPRGPWKMPQLGDWAVFYGAVSQCVPPVWD